MVEIRLAARLLRQPGAGNPHTSRDIARIRSAGSLTAFINARLA